MTKKLLLVILALIFCCIEFTYAQGDVTKADSPIMLADFESNNLSNVWGWNWVAWGDSNDGGNSQGKLRLDTPGDKGTQHALRFDFALHSTAKWEWCYSGFCASSDHAKDISAYRGVQLSIKSSKPMDKIEFTIYLIDQITHTRKPCTYTISCTNQYQQIAIPFSKLQVAGWWKARTPNYSPELDLSKCVEINFTKTGANGETGSFWIDEIAFYAQNSEGKISGEILPPSHTTISGRGMESGQCEAAITVDLNTPFVDPDSHNKGRISPNLYGSNWGSWLAALPAREKVLPLNLKVIRIGGNQMSRYNWRTSKYTMGGINAVYQQPSFDEFIEYCRSVHAEPLIQVNAMGWAPGDAGGRMENCMTAKDAADLVTYLNGKKGYHVKYFQVDNEFDCWHWNHRDLWGEKPCTGREYLQRYLAYAVAMREAQSATGSPEEIKIIGPEISSGANGFKSWDPTESYDGLDSFVPYFLRECKRFEQDKVRNPKGYKVIDILSFHHYPLFRRNYQDAKSFIPEGVPKMLESVQTWWNRKYINQYDNNQPKGVVLATIPRFNRWINEYYPGLELAVTELNVDAASSIRYDPVMKPLYQADLYGIMAKYGMDYVLQFALNSEDDSFGMVNQYNEVMPQYYPMMLYARYFKGTVLTASSDKGDLLNVYACDDGEGSIVLMVVNKNGRKDYPTKIQLSGYTGKALEGTFSYTFKEYSLTCIKIPKDKAKTEAEVWEYGTEQIYGK